jgi:hypothetical protein
MAPRSVFGPFGAASRRKCLGIDHVEIVESRVLLGLQTDASAGLLIRRSLVRAQVGEPIYMRPAAMRAVSIQAAFFRFFSSQPSTKATV